MSQQSFLEKLQLAPAASFHVLDPAKAARMNAKTLFIPSPVEVANAIAAIPKAARPSWATQNDGRETAALKSSASRRTLAMTVRTNKEKPE